MKPTGLSATKLTVVVIIAMGLHFCLGYIDGDKTGYKRGYAEGYKSALDTVSWLLKTRTIDSTKTIEISIAGQDNDTVKYVLSVQGISK